MKALTIATILVFILQQMAEAAPKGPKSRGFDADTERLKMTVLEEHEDYKLVQIPKSKWICSAKDLDFKDDPMRNWREEYDTPLEAMMNGKDKMASSDMFKKLFRYIVGVNKQQEEIKMTSPVLNDIELREGTKYRHTMCFWTGSPWEDKDIPTPINEDVFAMNAPAKEVYVRTFSGMPLSHDDWQKHVDKLMESLTRENIEFNSQHYYQLGYNSPWVPEDKRRNEIWMEKKDVENKEENSVWNKFQSKSSADDKLEMLPYKVLETNDMYELRQYESQKWVCTMMGDVDPTKDPMNGWEEKYGNNAYSAMAAGEWNDQPVNKMFMKLFKYIIGLNKDGQEIEMTRPVIITHLPKESGKEDEETCFWLGSEWQDKSAPEPIKEDVMIKQLDAMKVFVHRFGGFQMSYDDFHGPYMKLIEHLKADGRQFDESKWMHLSYNSPWTPKNRRNEVFVPQL